MYSVNYFASNYVKFRCYKIPQKSEAFFHFVLTLMRNVAKKWKTSSNFVAFSQYLNFTVIEVYYINDIEN